MSVSKVRPIAIYLPQFHPIPENDEWWGNGFTEWTNVTKARPLFNTHYQPHLPADLGFYDLRLPEAREAQAALAREFGIGGFCYYHYWFNGRRILERPFNEVFETGQPDFPFMLCWANENWSRAWDGSEKEILLQQHYNEEDDRNHIKYLLPFFKDKRYIRVDNKPVFVVYKSAALPNCKRTMEIWREEAAKEGMELYLCRVERWNSDNGKNIMEDHGFDAAIDFQPLSPSLSNYIKSEKISLKKNLKRVKAKLISLITSTKSQPGITGIDFEKYVAFDLKRSPANYKLYPCVTPSWDNSSRRKSGQLIFKNSSPALYLKWLRAKLKQFSPYSKDENFIFINAWNEWAEGNHLEPCQKWGRSFLDATKKALDEHNSKE